MKLAPARTQAEIDAWRRSLAGRAVLVIGAGRSGSACVHRLVEAGARPVLADRLPRERFAAVADEAEALGATVIPAFEALEQAPPVDLVILSPGVPPENPAVMAARAAGLEVIGSFEFAYRLCPAPIIAVTGTNGKGTTVRALAGMLGAAGIAHLLAGNIGTPLEDEIVRATPDTPAVVEVSSFQLETIVEFHPRVATVLNIAPDHLDRHPDAATYAAAKARIFENQEAEDFALVVLDDRAAREVGERSPARKLRISARDPEADATVRAGMLTVTLEGRTEVICPVADVPVPGAHNVLNLLVAATAARLLDAPPDAIAQAIRAYRATPDHLELVAEVGGVAFVNDSKATNPAAAVADLGALERPFVAIVGGKDKGAALDELGRLLAERARAVVVIGEAAERIAAAMGERARPERAATLPEAIRRAAELALPGDAVILAPACSSFDMFDDYAHRGRVFRETVLALHTEVEQ